MQVSLYRRYRPQKFGELVGQRTATDLLRLSLMEGRLGQAYLFSGPRGCGKTSAARIMAKAVNCEALKDGEPCGECASCRAVASNTHMDVLEIDAASNNGVDFIRDLREQVGLAPMMGRTKVYVLDEVHMLSGGAFNAFLKTLEEPPASVMFIMATTDPEKVPPTIRSRCQHVPFRRIDASLIASRVAAVAAEEGIECDAGAINEIARAADGAMRDALSLAEQAAAFGGGRITDDAVRSILGVGSRTELEKFISMLRTDAAGASSLMSGIAASGVKPERVLESLFPIVRDMWLFSLWGEGALEGAALSESETAFLREETPHWTSDQLKRCARAVTRLAPRARMGLRSDIFAGLLLFDMIDAREGVTSAPAPAQTATRLAPQSAPPQGTQATPVPRNRFVDRPMPVRGEMPRTEPARVETHRVETHRVEAPRVEALKRAEPPAQIAPPSADHSGDRPTIPLPPRLASLEPHIAAALVYASIVDDGGELAFDLSRAPEMARSILSMPRARAEVARAIGLAPSEPRNIDIPTAMPTPPPAQSEPPRRQTPVLQGASLGDKIAYLGAEILMQKPIDEDIADVDDAAEEREDS